MWLWFKMAVFWAIAQFCPKKVYQRIRGAYCLYHLHGATTQKTAIFILAAVRTWNLTWLYLFVTTFLRNKLGDEARQMFVPAARFARESKKVVVSIINYIKNVTNKQIDNRV
jgi:hypothetical protein